MIWIVLLLVAGLLAALIVLIMRTQQRGGGAGGTTTCGNCGYAVRGLERMTCPECGADFREVGMLTPLQRAGWMPTVMLALWICLSPIALCIVSAIILAIVPQVESATLSANYSSPESEAYRDVRVSGKGRFTTGWFGQPSAEVRPGAQSWVATFTTHRGPNVIVSVDRDAGTYRFAAGETVERFEGEVDANAFVAWWGEAVGEADEEKLRAEMEFLIAEVNRWRGARGGGVRTAGGGSPFRGGGWGGGGRSSPHPLIATIVIGAAVLIWVYGIVRISLWRRRLTNVQSTKR